MAEVLCCILVYKFPIISR